VRLFVLLSRFPYPLDKGDKLRAFHQLRILSQNHQIFLCALHEEPLKEDWIKAVQPYCEKIETIQISKATQFVQLIGALFSNRPFQVAYFFQPSALKQIENLIETWKPDVVYCQLLRTAEYVKGIAHIPKVIDFQDAFSIGIARRLDTDPIYLKPLLNSEKKRLEGYEKAIHKSFDGCTIISEQDRNQLPFAEKNEVVIVGNGVQMDVFAPSNAKKTEDILFAGNMGYPPNVEACVFLANEVMPLVWKTIPNARLMLAGARPSTQVRQLAEDRITVTGWVDDMRDCYAKSTLFVAPMMIGTGLQNKLLEAMAMQLPCVTTTLANNALKAKATSEIILAETAQGFAEAIIHLLRNPERAREIALNGHQFIQNNYSWEAQTKPLLALLEEVRT
jgi:sugar transferase (PEP-CTERM/EpsH1 system associated)